MGVADALAGTFLPRASAKRRAVLTLIPSSRSIARQDKPEARRAAILAASTLARGLPMRVPLALAFFIPALTRSRISSRSNSAIAPMMLNIRRRVRTEGRRQRRLGSKRKDSGKEKATNALTRTGLLIEGLGFRADAQSIREVESWKQDSLGDFLPFVLDRTRRETHVPPQTSGKCLCFRLLFF